METIIQVKGFEERDYNGTPWWTIDTDKDKMSCWDREIKDQLSGCYEDGKKAKVFVVTKEKNGKKLHNIKKFIGAVDAVVKPATTSGSITCESPKPTIVYQPTSMFVSYAKDIFIELVSGMSPETATPTRLEATMKQATELVKRATEDFS